MLLLSVIFQCFKFCNNITLYENKQLHQSALLYYYTTETADGKDDLLFSTFYRKEVLNIDSMIDIMNILALSISNLIAQSTLELSS